ncbi:GA-binding protein subunit beta-1-like [Saccostrea cucullata]|uniref:GA-binding protein subunit beta-1-like n=1 Tax=Saccostrea cuccullata TaxID=36930 RepID=UPI002ED4C3A5
MGDIDIVKVLIKAGARVDCKDNSGKTPLLLALEDGKFKIAEYLIKHGSDVNEVDDLGQSALHLVVSGQHNDCARIIRILFKCRYVMKDVDNWLSPEDLAANQKLQSIYLKQIQNANAPVKVNSMESIAIPRECFES